MTAQNGHGSTSIGFGGARRIANINTMWFVYIIRCSDDSLYTGITTDISRRLKEHNSKKGAFYTKNKIPVKLVYEESMAGQSQARKRESAIKSLTREEKLKLVGMKI